MDKAVKKAIWATVINICFILFGGGACLYLFDTRDSRIERGIALGTFIACGLLLMFLASVGSFTIEKALANMQNENKVG